MSGCDVTEKDGYRSALLRKMEELAGGRVNDVVRLAFLNEEGLGDLDDLDLSALSEFKRNSNGTVEIKLTNRLEVLEKLMALLDGGEHARAEAFFRALEERAVGSEVTADGVSSLLGETADCADVVV